MKRIIPVIRVSKESLEMLMKSRTGLVQQRIWVKDTTNKKGHWRMQWVHAGTGKTDATPGQMDLFGSEELKKPAPAKQTEDNPSHPHLGEYVGHGLGDNGRDYEGYRGKDGQVRFYDKKTGIELDEDGNMKKPKKETPTEKAKRMRSEILAEADKTGKKLAEKKPKAYKPAHPSFGEFVGHGVRADGRAYEMYRDGDGTRKYYFTDTGAPLAYDRDMENKDAEKELKSFETGKTYRHKTEGWEGEYLGHKTQDIATNGKHRLENVPGFKITKPADDKNHPSNFLKEMWGEVSFDEMNDDGTEDDGKGLMRKRREELVRKISATKEKLKTLDKTGEEAKKEKDKLKLMNEILQEFDDELSGKDSESTNGRKPKFELVKKQGSYHAKDPEALLSMSEDDFRRAFAEKYKKEHKKRSAVEDLMKQTKGPEYAWGIRDLLELKKFNSPKELLEQYKKYSNGAHSDALGPLTIGLHYALDDLQKRGADVKNDDLETIRDGWPRDAKFNEAVDRYLGGGMKKSALNLFREGLAKAFGATRA